MLLPYLQNLDMLGSIAVDAALTEGEDVFAAMVGVLVDATSAITDGADVMAAAVGTIIAASSETTDGADTLAGAVGVLIDASSATTDGIDALAGQVSPTVAFSSEWTDGADALVALVVGSEAPAPAAEDGGGSSGYSRLRAQMDREEQQLIALRRQIAEEDKIVMQLIKNFVEEMT